MRSRPFSTASTILSVTSTSRSRFFTTSCRSASLRSCSWRQTHGLTCLRFFGTLWGSGHRAGSFCVGSPCRSFITVRQTKLGRALANAVLRRLLIPDHLIPDLLRPVPLMDQPSGLLAAAFVDMGEAATLAGPVPFVATEFLWKHVPFGKPGDKVCNFCRKAPPRGGVREVAHKSACVDSVGNRSGCRSPGCCPDPAPLR